MNITSQLHSEGMWTEQNLSKHPRHLTQRVADNNPSATALDRAAETPYTSIKVLSRRKSDDQPLRTARFFNEPR